MFPGIIHGKPLWNRTPPQTNTASAWTSSAVEIWLSLPWGTPRWQRLQHNSRAGQYNDSSAFQVSSSHKRHTTADTAIVVGVLKHCFYPILPFDQGGNSYDSSPIPVRHAWPSLWFSVCSREAKPAIRVAPWFSVGASGADSSLRRCARDESLTFGGM